MENNERLMSIPVLFADPTDRGSLDEAISAFGCSDELVETDLIATLRNIENWCNQFSDKFRFNHQGVQIIWYEYESLIWALGEAFRRIMVRNRKLRRNESIFEGVRRVCSNKKYGKGRESFIMLLGQYGGSNQIPFSHRHVE
jgi:hypothetical protein